METTTTEPDANRLLRLRREKGLNQERLAVLAGISRGWLGFLERNPSAMTTRVARKLAAVLGVEAGELVVGERHQ